MSASQPDQSVHAITRGQRHHFFGYYDKCPWDATGRCVLGLETTFIDRVVADEDVAVIGLIDTEEGDAWTPIAETRAWNWQQGAMLQWHPAAPDRLIIYNDRADDGYVTMVMDVRSGETRTLPLPVAAVSRDGRQALSINFARLNRHRPYGYVGLPDPTLNDLHPADDGIRWLDLETGESRLIITVDQIARFRPKPSMTGSSHWFNHLQFNTNDTRFCFLHRWTVGTGWLTQLFTAALDGSDLRLVADDDLVSHFDWRDERRILVWARRPERGDRFYLIDDETGDATVVGEGILTADGHCSYSPDREWILADTYPRERRERVLSVYSVAGDRRIDLGAFHSPAELDGAIRCDLHPRWNRDGTAVCFDSAHEGTRQIYVTDLIARDA